MNEYFIMKAEGAFVYFLCYANRKDTEIQSFSVIGITTHNPKKEDFEEVIKAHRDGKTHPLLSLTCEATSFS